MDLEAAFEVACFVLVDDAGTGQFVEHCAHLGEERFGGGFVAGIAQGFYGVARCFVVVTVAQTACLRLADPF